MIEVELPDGSVAEFPDGTPPEVMKQAIQRKFGPPQQQAAPEPVVSTGEDMVRSGAAGVRQGSESMAGGFGDTNSINGDIGSWAAKKLGLGETGQNVTSWLMSHANPATAMLPSTSDIRQVTDKFMGESYKPQTTAGEYSRTVGQFVPGAALGPGSLGRKVASAIVPGIASEAAGQFTKGSPIEPYARAAGGLAGGILTAGRATPKAPKVAMESADDLAARSQALYDSADAAGVVIQPQEMSRLAQNVELAAGNLNTNLRPNTAGIVQEAKAIAGKPVTLRELDEFRQTVGLAMKRAEPQDVRTLQKIKNVVDHFADATPNITAGDAKGFGFQKEARALWARKAKTEVLDDIIEKAKNQATGFENGLVIQMRSLANNKKRIASFSPAEQEMIKDVVRRGSVTGILRTFGMLAPNSTFGAFGAVGTTLAGGGVGGLAGLGVGTAAKAAAGKMTMGKMDRLQRAVSSGVAPGPVGGGQINLDALTRLLLNAQSGQNSALSNAPLNRNNQ